MLRNTTNIAINEFYKLSNTGNINQYTSSVSQGLDYDQYIQELCQPGTTWTRHERGSMTFPQSCLSRYGKAWYAFICTKRMPCTHVSDQTKERAVLLYCLVKGKKMDVGFIIKQLIMSAAGGGGGVRTTEGLPHPSLICALCAKYGVK